MKNYLIYTLLMTVVIISALFGMSFIPPITINGHTLREVDLLADIRISAPEDTVLPQITIPKLEDLVGQELVNPKDSLNGLSDSSFIAPQEPLTDDTEGFENTHTKIIGDDSWQSVDTNKDGVTLIVDYSSGSKNGIRSFYQSLINIEDRESSSRIAFFGDSFIEGDILTSDLRSLLQSKYGGCGVGFVPITSQTSGFRPTVVHSFSGWSSYSAVDKKYARKKLGMDGHYFVPTKPAYVELKGQKKYGAHLDTCEISTLYFKNPNSINITAKVNDEEPTPFTISGLNELQAIEVEGNIGRIRWNTSTDSTAIFYGAAMDGLSGVSLDNFSLRGSAGHYISGVPTESLTQFNKLRPYNLIVLQYGLNVLATGVYDYNYYRVVMTKAITHLKESFPNTSILVVSIGDRGHKNKDGYYSTMPELKYFLEIQRQIAKENKVAFWNMFEAMGGENSMKDFVKAKPAKANLDYTHINFRGGKTIANKLMDAIVQGVHDFENKEIYEGK